jgi:hypothetical protein
MSAVGYSQSPANPELEGEAAKAVSAVNNRIISEQKKGLHLFIIIKSPREQRQ